MAAKYCYLCDRNICESEILII